MRHLLGLLAALVATHLYATPVSPDAMRAYLIRYEGYRLTPYRDGNHWAVGVGHSLTAHRQAVRAYSRVEVERFLWTDLSWSLDACRRGVRDFDDLPHEVQLLCVGVAFTVGRTGFERFRQFRLALSHRAYNAAAHELRWSKWFTQVSAARANAAVRVLLAL